MSKRVEYNFPTEWGSILKKIDEIDPVKYARSRNFIGIIYIRCGEKMKMLVAYSY